ncbi:MAG: Asp-tRNA(Asn)/Glu-tRNA(Gln) amidotransferase subunit GatB [Caulobacterales bacterium]|nr:Asp-tRNA(Asn)/Glu-tRNA(Gln) amidotransferase subunit GatB [Caulobacterales bacterium]MCA0373449.1 Asp-tRNA(Asn)/Glu-tRNA(Gln) amidotransferase subunit GatB [Pseudomonadota bacterium]
MSIAAEASEPVFTAFKTARPDQWVKGVTGDWEIIVGMEVHAQVAAKAKLFSGASAAYGGEPNSHVSFVDAGMPGMLPVINKYCVEQAVRTGLGLGAKINLWSRFDRKNYFYPDLPQGYQISQYLYPIVGQGVLEIESDDKSTIEVGIERIHLEQDAGKSVHDLDPNATYVDLNRSGCALMEIVSKPDIRSPEEAANYFKALRSLVRYLGTCDGNMDEGSMRADVNVSVRKPGGELGTRCEIKNVNSTKFVAMAVAYEARRQIEILEDGGTIDQETRLFDVKTGQTRTMRSKEDAHDYRYFPDPDLLPLVITQEFVDGIKATLPELPSDKRKRFIADYGLSAYDAGVLVADKEFSDYFEEAAKGTDAKMVNSWMTVELFGYLNKNGIEFTASPVSAQNLGGLVKLIQDGTINGKIAKDVFAKMIESGDDASTIVERDGLKQTTDTGAIEAAIDALMAQSPEKVDEAREKPKMLGWWVGQVMKSTGGKANPAIVNDILKRKLGIE